MARPHGDVAQLSGPAVASQSRPLLRSAQTLPNNGSRAGPHSVGFFIKGPYPIGIGDLSEVTANR